jgi:hypothetical protein
MNKGRVNSVKMNEKGVVVAARKAKSKTKLEKT